MIACSREGKFGISSGLFVSLCRHLRGITHSVHEDNFGTNIVVVVFFILFLSIRDVEIQYRYVSRGQRCRAVCVVIIHPLFSHNFRLYLQTSSFIFFAFANKLHLRNHHHNKMTDYGHRELSNGSPSLRIAYGKYLYSHKPHH